MHDSPASLGPPPRPSYQHHAGFYRSINPGHDLSRSWEASPYSDRSLPVSPFKPVFEIPKHYDPAPKPTVLPTKKIREDKRDSRKSLWKRLLQVFKPMPVSLAISTPPPVVTSIPENPYSERVPLFEWKQYGYWARPYINDIMVENSPVTSEKTITSEVLADLIANVRGIQDPEFDIFPERWIVGAKHRALPPRPARWKEPDPNAPLPFPWEVQLNPLLHHVLWGAAPLRWCIWEDPFEALWYGRTSMHVMCTDADRAQPGTWPFLTHMYFNAVLGDDARKYPWPFTVYNPRGIKVGDILAEIHYQFQIPISPSEFGSWPGYRQVASRRTLEQRNHVRKLAGQSNVTDCIRRCDALGAQMFFRGIEPSVDGGGWMIAFGTY